MKNIDYDYKAVHLLNDGGEQLKDDFAAKNPSKELPCLEIDGESGPVHGYNLLPGRNSGRWRHFSQRTLNYGIRCAVCVTSLAREFNRYKTYEC